MLRGLDSTPRPSTPIVFPGNGATVPLHSFVTESPEPDDDVRMDRLGRAPADRHDAGRRDVRERHVDRTDRPDRRPACCTRATSATAPPGRSSTATTPWSSCLAIPLADGTYIGHRQLQRRQRRRGRSTSTAMRRSSAPAPPPPPEPVNTTPATEAGRFDPVTPFRYVDSRIGRGAVRLAGGSVTADPRSPTTPTCWRSAPTS